MAPDEVITRPLFKSLPYIAAQHGNPFSKGAILYIQTPKRLISLLLIIFLIDKAHRDLQFLRPNTALFEQGQWFDSYY